MLPSWFHTGEHRGRESFCRSPCKWWRQVLTPKPKRGSTPHTAHQGEPPCHRSRLERGPVDCGLGVGDTAPRGDTAEAPPETWPDGSPLPLQLLHTPGWSLDQGIDSAQELARDADFQAPPRSCCGRGCIFTRSSCDSNAREVLRGTVLPKLKAQESGLKHGASGSRNAKNLQAAVSQVRKSPVSGGRGQTRSEYLFPGEGTQWPREMHAAAA